MWSVKALEGPQKGRVVARTGYVELENVRPRVSQKGRDRVLREKRKNVHAGLVGEWVGYGVSVYSVPLPETEITYNPYKSGNFYYRQTPESDYTGSDFAELLVRDGKAKVFAYDRAG
jgi:hypothetical protein